LVEAMAELLVLALVAAQQRQQLADHSLQDDRVVRKRRVGRGERRAHAVDTHQRPESFGESSK